ncbi:hypothetical protein GUY59_33845 [Nonomuraea sp. K271]|nr:hypothetical protein [Nonomuraea sp. K271]
MFVLVTAVVDTLVLALDVEDPVLIEIVVGDQGTELQDGLGPRQSPPVR